MTRIAPVDAPFRSYTTTPDEAFAEGHAIGMTWARDYRPIGPHVCTPSHDSDPDFIDFCRRQKENTAEWLRGFDEGLAVSKI